MSNPNSPFIHRKKDFVNFGFWICGPLVIFMTIYSIQFDITLYPTVWTPKWVVIRALTIPLSILTMIYYKSQYGEDWPEFPTYFLALYLTGQITYLQILTNPLTSIYYNAHVQVLLAGAMLPFRVRSFLLISGIIVSGNFLSFVSLEVSAGEIFENPGVATFLSYVVMAFLIFFSFAKLRSKQYAMAQSLDEENRKREHRIQELVADQIESRQVFARAQLATQVAHDIKSPLSALQIALSGIDHDDLDRKELVNSALTRIKTICTDLLQYAKKESQSKSPEDLLDIVTEIRKEKRVIAAHVDLQINSSLISPILIHSENVATVLKRAISNIVDNAIDTIATSGTIEIHITKTGSDIEISVKDSGPGIDPKLLPWLLKEKVVSKKENGTGIGLFTANQNIKSIGGHISIDSALGAGTTVKIHLPISI